MYKTPDLVRLFYFCRKKNMKNLFVLCLCLLCSLGFSQSKKNNKKSFITNTKQVALVSKDSLNTKKSVFLKLKDTVSSNPSLNIPSLTLSNDLSVYSKDVKKKKSSGKVNDLLLHMQLQQDAMYHQQQMMQAQQQAQSMMQQNMMRIP